MTFATAAKTVGRQPFQFIEIDLDTCFLNYGESWTNKLKRSEEFDHSDWSKTGGLTVTADNVLAPSGLFEADKITSDTTADPHFYQDVSGESPASASYTFSVWLWTDAGQPTDARLYLYLYPTSEVDYLDITLREYPVRFSFTNTFSAGATETIVRARVDLTPFPSDGDYLYVFGAQLVKSSAMGHYVKTTTAAATKACTAAGSSGSECFNTFKTCQDTDNYSRGIKSYRFCNANSNSLPKDEWGMIPCLNKINLAPTKITAGKGLGQRAKVTATFIDFPHHDRGVDPYWSTRTYDPAANGTFFRKLRARTPYYQGRIMRIWTGYWTDPFTLANFDKREYVIESIKGPNNNDQIQIIAKDILKLADDKRAKVPLASQGYLASSITSESLSATLGPSGIGDSEYPASGYIKINSEIIAFTRSSDTLTITRAHWGTSAASHNAEDTAQLCVAYEKTNVVDVIEDLLTNYANIDANYIDSAEWADEKTTWLSTLLLTNILHDPEGVTKILEQLTEQCQVQLWWDERAQKIKLRAIVPQRSQASVDVLDDDSHFEADSIEVSDLEGERLTEVWIWFAPNDYTENDKKNFSRLYIQADTDAEGVNQFGDQRVLEIESMWLDDASTGAAISTAGRILQRRTQIPREIVFNLDAKDFSSYWTGDIFDIETSMLVDEFGLPDTTRVQVMEASEEDHGTRFKYKVQTGLIIRRYGFIGPNTLNDYGSESAANKAAYAFVAANSAPYFSDGEDAYRIL